MVYPQAPPSKGGFGTEIGSSKLEKDNFSFCCRNVVAADFSPTVCYEMSDHPGTLLFVPAHSRVLYFGEELDERLSERGHDVGRVEDGEPADDAHGQLPYLEDLVVEGHEEGRQVLGLGQVVVEAIVQTLHHTTPDVGVLVYDPHLKPTNQFSSGCFGT